MEFLREVNFIDNKFEAEVVLADFGNARFFNKTMYEVFGNDGTTAPEIVKLIIS